jgi:hypothetical protein
MAGLSFGRGEVCILHLEGGRSKQNGTTAHGLIAAAVFPTDSYDG